MEKTGSSVATNRTVVYPMRMSTATSRTNLVADSSAELENPYESNKLLSEYLLFHYGTAEEVLPFAQGPKDALAYPVRCVSECLKPAELSRGGRALDLGCAVGRSTFELARHCEAVLGIDYSHSFIAAAERIRTEGEVKYERVEEGEISTPLVAHRPAEVASERVRFEQGDAVQLREGLGRFDIVLMANLIDRLQKPAQCLAQLGDLVEQDGTLVITSPYTWMEAYTSKTEWLGGFQSNGQPQLTLDGLRANLAPHFKLERTLDLPFLIREHARKYQWSVAQASIWRRLL